MVFPSPFVMAGLVPAIHDLLSNRVEKVRKAWMPGTRPGMTETSCPGGPYIVAPSTHGANSAPPKSKLSLLVGAPEAVARRAIDAAVGGKMRREADMRAIRATFATGSLTSRLVSRTIL